MRHSQSGHVMRHDPNFRREVVYDPHDNRGPNIREIVCNPHDNRGPNRREMVCDPHGNRGPNIREMVCNPYDNRGQNIREMVCNPHDNRGPNTREMVCNPHDNRGRNIFCAGAHNGVPPVGRHHMHGDRYLIDPRLGHKNPSQPNLIMPSSQIVRPSDDIYRSQNIKKIHIPQENLTSQNKEEIAHIQKNEAHTKEKIDSERYDALAENKAALSEKVEANLEKGEGLYRTSAKLSPVQSRGSVIKHESGANIGDNKDTLPKTYAKTVVAESGSYFNNPYNRTIQQTPQFSPNRQFAHESVHNANQPIHRIVRRSVQPGLHINHQNEIQSNASDLNYDRLSIRSNPNNHFYPLHNELHHSQHNELYHSQHNGSYYPGRPYHDNEFYRRPCDYGQYSRERYWSETSSSDSSYDDHFELHKPSLSYNEDKDEKTKDKKKKDKKEKSRKKIDKTSKNDLENEEDETEKIKNWYKEYGMIRGNTEISYEKLQGDDYSVEKDSRKDKKEKDEKKDKKEKDGKKDKKEKDGKKKDKKEKDGKKKDKKEKGEVEKWSKEFEEIKEEGKERYEKLEAKYEKSHKEVENELSELKEKRKKDNKKQDSDKKHYKDKVIQSEDQFYKIKKDFKEIQQDFIEHYSYPNSQSQEFRHRDDREKSHENNVKFDEKITSKPYNTMKEVKDDIIKVEKSKFEGNNNRAVVSQKMKESDKQEHNMTTKNPQSKSKKIGFKRHATIEEVEQDISSAKKELKEREVQNLAVNDINEQIWDLKCAKSELNELPKTQQTKDQEDFLHFKRYTSKEEVERDIIYIQEELYRRIDDNEPYNLLAEQLWDQKCKRCDFCDHAGGAKGHDNAANNRGLTKKIGFKRHATIQEVEYDISSAKKELKERHVQNLPVNDINEQIWDLKCEKSEFNKLSNTQQTKSQQDVLPFKRYTSKKEVERDIEYVQKEIQRRIDNNEPHNLLAEQIWDQKCKRCDFCDHTGGAKGHNNASKNNQTPAKTIAFKRHATIQEVEYDINNAKKELQERMANDLPVNDIQEQIWDLKCEKNNFTELPSNQNNYREKDFLPYKRHNTKQEVEKDIEHAQNELLRRQGTQEPCAKLAEQVWDQKCRKNEFNNQEGTVKGLVGKQSPEKIPFKRHDTIEGVEKDIKTIERSLIARELQDEGTADLQEKLWDLKCQKGEFSDERKSNHQNLQTNTLMTENVNSDFGYSTG